MAEVSFLKVLNWSEDECRAYLTEQRWPNGIACPRCGVMEPYRIERKSPTKNAVKSLWKCRGCKRQFTETVGTIFEGSKIPLNKWFAGIYLLCSSKKGMSAHQMHRQLDVTYKTAWFMLHRIRLAMKNPDSPFMLSGTVEADETYIGGKARNMHASRRKALGINGSGYVGKIPVVGVIERGGRVVTEVMDNPNRQNVESMLLRTIDVKRSNLITDEAGVYRFIAAHLPHEVIRHQSEYVRGEIHTNNIEGYWGIVKRGLYGVYHHVDRGYLGCYLDEFSFRFNRRKMSDAERFQSALGQADAHGRLRWFFRDEVQTSSDSATG